jgi:putative transposase
VKPPQDALRRRLREMAEVRVAYRYRRLHVLLRREGWPVNAKRVHHLYKDEGFSMRKLVPKRRVSYVKPEVLPTASKKNARWSMDFVSDQLFDGRRSRTLTPVDNCTREALTLHTAPRIKGIDVVEVLNRIPAEHGFSSSPQVGNGSEFISKDVDL